jgi:uncharacterized damage-inducible protein DinB
MFRNIGDFKKEWSIEAKATADFIRGLTTESLEQRIDPEGGRTLGRVAWHITTTINEMMNRTGLNVSGANDHDPIPPHPAMIADQYEVSANSLLEEVTAKWTNDMLMLTDDMYGQPWHKGETLLNLITHQAHHRGEMVVLARQAGLKPQLGVYGPTREAWAAMGMEALA